MTTYDNAPPLPGWETQPGRHCGQLCFDRTCKVCGEYVQPATNLVLGEN